MSTPDLGAIRRRMGAGLKEQAWADVAALCDRVEALQVALVKAAIPLEVIVADESVRPMREISPTLRAAIRKGVEAIRAVLVGTK